MRRRSCGLRGVLVLGQGVHDFFACRTDRVTLGIASGNPYLPAQGLDRRSFDCARKDFVLLHVVGETVVIPVIYGGLDDRFGVGGEEGHLTIVVFLRAGDQCVPPFHNLICGEAADGPGDDLALSVEIKSVGDSADSRCLGGGVGRRVTHYRAGEVLEPR